MKKYYLYCTLNFFPLSFTVLLWNEVFSTQVTSSHIC